MSKPDLSKVIKLLKIPFLFLKIFYSVANFQFVIIQQTTLNETWNVKTFSPAACIKWTKLLLNIDYALHSTYKKLFTHLVWEYKNDRRLELPHNFKYNFSIQERIYIKFCKKSDWSLLRLILRFHFHFA